MSFDQEKFDREMLEEIIETIESLGCKYLIKAKAYATLVSQVTASSAVFLKGIDGRETAELLIKLDKWKKKRRFVVSRVLKPEKQPLIGYLIRHNGRSIIASLS